MKLTVTSAAIVALSPLESHAWTFGSGFMRPILVYSSSPRKLARKNLATPFTDNVITQTSPRYAITDDDTKFQVAIDAPGYKTQDVSVSVEEDGHVLSIVGTRENSGDNYSFSSKFSQSFSLDPVVDAEKLTASLNDGVLLVTAPKDVKRIEDGIRKIPVTQGLPQTDATTVENKELMESAENIEDAVVSSDEA